MLRNVCLFGFFRLVALSNQPRDPDAAKDEVEHDQSKNAHYLGAVLRGELLQLVDFRRTDGRLPGSAFRALHGRVLTSVTWKKVLMRTSTKTARRAT